MDVRFQSFFHSLLSDFIVIRRLKWLANHIYSLQQGSLLFQAGTKLNTHETGKIMLSRR